jgi:HEAT repeat protein
MYTLLYQLESGTWEDRKQACEALGLTGNPNALKPLLRATEDPDVEVREAASKALGQLGAPGAAAELATLLPREPEPRVRIALIDTLGRLRDACAVPVLSELLTDLDVSIRFAACRAPTGDSRRPSISPTPMAPVGQRPTK